MGRPKVRGRIDTIATPLHPSSRAARRTRSQDFTPGGQTEPVEKDSVGATQYYGPGGHGGMSRVPPAARKLVKMVERSLKREGGPAECAENFLFTIADLMGSRDPLMDRLDEARVIASNIIATGFAGHHWARKYYGALKRDLSPKCFKFLVKQTKKARGEGPAPLDDTADEFGSLPPLDEGDVSREKRMRDMEQDMPQAAAAPDPMQQASPASLIDQARSLISKLTKSTQASVQGRNMQYSPSRSTKKSLEELDALLDELSEYVGAEQKDDHWFDDEHETMADRKFADRPQDEEDTFSADKESYIARESKLRR
ncbi:MAG: hypothetical protein F3745_00060 [Nitrospinae bacterium]|nr:hypothetical protein [Nitrospinota bacterium]